MQAALAVMAAHTVFAAVAATSAAQQPLLFPAAISSASSPSVQFHSSFHGVAIKAKVRPFLSLSAAAAPKPLTVVSATKKAVSVLKGTAGVEGVVTLTQDGDGKHTLLSQYFSFLYLFSIVLYCELSLNLPFLV